MSKKLVKEYYTELGVGEWERLTKTPYNRLELDTTLHYLDKHLPPEGHILDAGCGPGRYTVTLAKRGYTLTGLDLTPHLLEIAREQAEKAGVTDLVKLQEGSVEDLSTFEDGTFDAVMCLGGPLSHMVHEERRQRAADELIRVAKPGATVFASVIGRLAVCMNSVVYLWPEMLTAPDVYRDYTPREDTTPGDTGSPHATSTSPRNSEKNSRTKQRYSRWSGWKASSAPTRNGTTRSTSRGTTTTSCGRRT